ncbi:hypothetical protein ACFV0T_23080 [Streptomyces sp. NPDC059582]|uniref:hypothetical protein n=1 Tax=Streptomyces sp. NPDC059582 TaxID=3346875 RepID=UPI0036D09798
MPDAAVSPGGAAGEAAAVDLDVIRDGTPRYRGRTERDLGGDEEVLAVYRYS